MKIYSMKMGFVRLGSSRLFEYLSIGSKIFFIICLVTILLHFGPPSSKSSNDGPASQIYSHFESILPTEWNPLAKEVLPTSEILTNRYRAAVEPFNDTALSSLLLPDAHSDCRSSISKAFVFPKLKNVCEWVLLSKSKVSAESLQTDSFNNFNQTLLIVSIFQPKHFAAIYKAYRLYHGIFYRIIFCLTGMAEFRTFEDGRFAHLENVSFVEFHPNVTTFTGAVFYNCIPAVLDAVPQIRQMVELKQLDGILHISDDLVPNVWKFTPKDHPLHYNWHLAPAIHIYDVDQHTKCVGATGNNTLDCTDVENWSPLNVYGRGLIDAMNELQKEQRWFIENLAKSTKGRRRVYNIYADLFYIANDFIFNASKVFRVFAKHQVYMELVVGTVINGLTDPSVTSFKLVSKAGQQYGAGRSVPIQETYSAQDFFYHPFKMEKVEFNTIDKQCLYCQLVETFDLIRKTQFGLDIN